MALLVALHGKDGLVAVADSRGTFGDPRGVTAQNDSQRKVHLVSPHAALMFAGAGELGAQMLVEISKVLNQAGPGGSDGASNVLEVARRVCRQKYQEWFPHLPPAIPPGIPQLARPDLAFLCVGYDPGPSGRFEVPRIYQSLSAFDFPPMLHEYGFAIIGVTQYALYLLNRLFEPDRSLAELTSLAVYVITETASQDGKVGGPVRVVTISPEGGRELTRAQVEGIQEANEERAAALRRSFYTS